jgi:hypothetical protein
MHWMSAFITPRGNAGRWMTPAPTRPPPPRPQWRIESCRGEVDPLLVTRGSQRARRSVRFGFSLLQCLLKRVASLTQS